MLEDTIHQRRAAGARGDRPALAGALAALAVVALALAVRLAGLGNPGELMVDERYYVTGARNLLARGYEPSYVAPVEGQPPAVHPPLGKWLIAAGIWLAGDRPFGWRVAAALAGTATVALVYLCGRRLFAGRAPALAAALLLAVEHLSVVQSRTAMLDVFLAFWIVAGFYALLRDRDAARAHLTAACTPPRVPVVGAQDAEGGGWVAGAPPRPPPVGARDPEGSRRLAGLGRVERRRGWRLAAGALLGCAVATKWSGAWVLPVAALLALAWETALRRGSGPALRQVVWQEGSSIITAFALVPVSVYVASHAGAFLAGGFSPLAWWQDQLRVLEFHATLSAGHPYASSAWSWLVTRRPVAYFYAQPEVPGSSGPVPGAREVLALGHPLLFLAITPAALWAATRWARVRLAASAPTTPPTPSARADEDRALGATLLFALALWLPWIAQDRPMFLFYMTPVVPFVVLLQGAALARLAQSGRAGRALAGAALAAAVALFWFHWPVLTGAPITHEAWADRVADWRHIPLWRPDWV